MKTSKTSPKRTRPADPLASRPLDLSKAVRGKYYARMQAGTNVLLLDPDLMQVFPDSESVNRALRAFLAIGENVQAASIPRRRPTSARPAAKSRRTASLG